MKLSILIPTLPSRLPHFLPRLLSILEPQIHGKPIELLGLLDNKTRSLGAKRNELLRMASSPYLTFIDDDDVVAGDYADSILAAMETNPDVICFWQNVTIDGGPPKRCEYSLQYDYVETPELWRGLPSHTMVWKSEIAKRHAFPEKNYAEDSHWCKRVSRDAVTEVQIPKTLYFYEFSRLTTETRTTNVNKNRRFAQLRKAQELP